MSPNPHHDSLIQFVSNHRTAFVSCKNQCIPNPVSPMPPKGHYKFILDSSKTSWFCSKPTSRINDSNPVYLIFLITSAMTETPWSPAHGLLFQSLE